MGVLEELASDQVILAVVMAIKMIMAIWDAAREFPVVLQLACILLDYWHMNGIGIDISFGIELNPFQTKVQKGKPLRRYFCPTGSMPRSGSHPGSDFPAVSGCTRFQNQ